MIYFKICKCIKDDVNTNIPNTLEEILELETIVLVKIGFSGDETKSDRGSAYRTENPNIIHFKNYAGGNRKDESAIHKRFKDKLFRGHEWFVFDQEILDFTQRNLTIENIRAELINFYDFSGREKYVQGYVNVILNDVSDPLLRFALRKSIVEELCRVEPVKLREYIIRKHGFDVYIKYREWLDSIGEGDQSLLSRFNGLTTFPDKIKFIHNVEVSLDPENMGKFLDRLPGKFKDYYLAFGTERMKELKYREVDIEREWNKLVNNSGLVSKLSELIYEKFRVGEKYLRSQIKETLYNLYLTLGYQQTPKASDLNEYFNTKDVLINGSRGYKIISKK